MAQMRMGENRRYSFMVPDLPPTKSSILTTVISAPLCFKFFPRKAMIDCGSTALAVDSCAK